MNFCKGEMMKTSRLLALLAFASFAPVVLGQSQGQGTYPNKPVRIIVAFAPGGIADVAARLVAAKLTEAWGQNVIVENRAGGGGSIGVVAAARSAPDGYTVLATTTSIAVNPSLSGNAGYDIDKDLLPVINLASSPNLFAAYPGAGATTLRQFIDKAKTGKLNYGSAGSGTTPHLSAEYLFKILAKVNVTHVPYKGAGPAVAAAVAGEVEVASVAMPPVVPQVKAGRLIGLAVTSNKRVAALPDVPTVAESGFPGFEDYTWVGFFMPAGTPPEAVNRFNSEINKLLATQDMKDRLAALGFEPVGGSPAEFGRYVTAEVQKWAKVVKDTGAKAE
jgi:tripartite-type tricarboxylate transporter receptor subunit TctC